MKKTSTLAITIAILGVVWAAAIAVYTMVLALPWMCWGSISCTAIAILVAELYLLAFRKDPGEQGAEPGVLGIIFTICFLLIVALLNSVFVLLGCGDFNWVLVTLNLLANAGYILLLLWTEQSSARLARQMEQTERKTAPSVNIARKLGELLAITEDAQIREKLLKLKEAVDYGTNISTNATAEREMQMAGLLDEIAQLTIARADRLIILNKIDAAEKTWKMRSNAASSVR